MVSQAGIPALNRFNTRTASSVATNKPGRISIGNVSAISPYSAPANRYDFPAINSRMDSPMPITPPMQVSTRFSIKTCVRRFRPVAPNAFRTPISSFRFCTDDCTTPVRFSAGTRSRKRNIAPDSAMNERQSTFRKPLLPIAESICESAPAGKLTS